MTYTQIHKLNQLLKRRDMIERKIQSIKRLAEKNNNPVLQFDPDYTHSVSIARDQVPELFDEVYDLVLSHLQDKLNELNATLDKANNILKECIADEI